MAFTGKATYDGGAGLPELTEDVSDVIGLIGAYETALLDHLGDARRAATSTVHEWLEDELVATSDVIDQAVFNPNGLAATSFDVANGSRFRVGDVLRPEASGERLMVTGVSGNTLTVVRGYGGTTPETLQNDQVLHIVGNAALEGAERGASATTNRVRKTNYTQIFTKSIEVSGTQLAAAKIGVRDEMDYQMQERLRELLRDLENTVINGVRSATDPQGSSTVRRTMDGILSLVQSNRFLPGVDEIPAGGGDGEDELTEPVLNSALRVIWESSGTMADTIVVGGAQKRRINAFIGDGRSYAPRDTTFRDMVGVYESDFGVCRVVLSRWAPADTVLLLDSSRIEVMPFSGRSFGFKRLSSNGDSEVGQVLGEYTLQLMNERAHGVIEGLAA